MRAHHWIAIQKQYRRLKKMRQGQNKRKDASVLGKRMEFRDADDNAVAQPKRTDRTLVTVWRLNKIKISNYACDVKVRE
jgi:hypothetical protein